MSGLSDEEVFGPGGPQKGMTDEEVFGRSLEPPTAGEAIPEAFLDRVRAGQALGRILSAAGHEAKEGAADQTPTGYSDERLGHMIDIGVFHDPAMGRPGPLQMANEAVLFPIAQAWQSVTGAINAGIHGAGGAVEQLVTEFGGSQGTAQRAKNEVINASNWAMIEGGMGRFSRPAATPEGVTDQQVGGLPKPEDFTNAAKVLTPREVPIAQFRRDAAAITKAADPVGEGFTRLWRGNRVGEVGQNPSFTTDLPGIALPFREGYKGDLSYVDVPTADLPKYARSGGAATDAELILPPEIASQAKVADLQKGATASEITEANLRRMWQEDGIHPAEAVHDAQTDAFVKNEITSPREPVVAPGAGNLRLVEAPEGGVYTPEQVKPNEKYFKAVDSDGNVSAEVLVRFDGKTANIEDILAPGKLREEGRGAIGTSEMRSILRQFQEAHPEIEKITGKRVSGANMGGGYSLLKDPTQVEVNLRPSSVEAGIKDFVDNSPEGTAHSLGAAAIDMPPDVSLRAQPASPPGRLAAAFQNATETLMDLGRDAQMKIAPMATGTQDSMAMMKDFANALRRNRWDWSRMDKDLADRFTPEQRARMWSAADEESVSLQLKEPASMREHQGLATLTPEERAAVEEQHTRAQNAWIRARDIGMVEGEGLPAYTPRMIINAMGAGSKETALALDGIGRNLKTKTANMLKRKYLEAQETEAAAKAKYGDEAMLARDIRVLPLATSQLEDAIAGRTAINNIRDYGARTGTDTLVEGAIPAGSDTKWFTLDHPAFKTWRPKFEEGQVVKDAEGKTIFEQVPIYVHGDFEGPLRAVLSQRSGPLYGAMMSLKGKTMSLIMNSPMIHNAVEFGRAFPAMPLRIFKAYFEGNRAKNDVGLMHEAIDNGLVPIGHRFFNQDITSVMEAPDLTPGRSWTAKALGETIGRLPQKGLSTEEVMAQVKGDVDKAGDFWHNTLLWDRIGDLQMGLYVNMRRDIITKGVDPQTASRMAAHLANRYAGSLPKEAMSDAATKAANMMLFSRTFTMGNLGVIKDAFTGLPKDVLAQIERDMGTVDPNAVGYAKSMARRKAFSVVMMDIGLLYVGNSVMQSALSVMLGDHTMDEESHGYVRRYRDMMADAQAHPMSLVTPMSLAGGAMGAAVGGLPGAVAGAVGGTALSALRRLSSTSENEPGKEDRLKVGYSKDGTAIYARSPFGKIGEEFVGYLNSPLDMAKRKEGTLMRPMMQVFNNDKGFGRKIYDPDAETPAARAWVMWQVIKHIGGSQLPEGQIGAFSDLVKGEGDAKVNQMQAFGPFVGTTFSKGAPGGPAVGEMYHAKSQFEFRVQQAMPDIRKQILRGDQPGAEKAMQDLGMDPAYSRWVVKTTLNPATRLGSKAMRDFYRTATPEQRDRMTRMQPGAAYTGPNLGPVAPAVTSPPQKDPRLIMNGPQAGMGIRG